MHRSRPPPKPTCSTGRSHGATAPVVGRVSSTVLPSSQRGTRSRREPGEDQVMVLHVGPVAAEARFVLRFVDGLAADEAAEPSAAGGSVLFRVLDHELNGRRGAWYRGGVEFVG